VQSPSDTPLRLYQEVTLLALRDKEGTVHFGAAYQYGLAAALIAELLLEGRVAIAADGRRQLVDLVDRTPFDDELLDECLTRLQDAKRRASLKTWVTRFAGLKRLKARAAETLVRSRILKSQEGRVLVFFPRTTYPARDPKPEREIVARMRRAIFSGSSEIDPRTTLVVALAHASGILPHVFDKKRLKDRKARLQHITDGSLVGKATKEVIEAVNAAVIAAATAAAVATRGGR
jgi:Golgi phosphoprotein 3